MDGCGRRLSYQRIALVSLLLLAGAACGSAPPRDPVVLSLGSQELRRSDFEAYVKGLETRDGPLGPAVRRSLLDSYLEERVLVMEARRRGLLHAGASTEEEQAAVQKLLSDTVLAHLAVDDAQIAEYYDAHKAEFNVPETVTLSQILVPTENEARELLRRLQLDPKSFELLARTRSRAPEAAEGGRMGSFARGQLPSDLEAVAFSLRPGAHSDVIKTPLGYHVLRVDAREPARARGLDECRAEIRAKLLRDASDRAVKAFVHELLSRAKVNYEAAIAPAA
jgi:peptidyl-prolyl cis-trans isomerase C